MTLPSAERHRKVVQVGHHILAANLLFEVGHRLLQQFELFSGDGGRRGTGRHNGQELVDRLVDLHGGLAIGLDLGLKRIDRRNLYLGCRDVLSTVDQLIGHRVLCIAEIRILLTLVLQRVPQVKPMVEQLLGAPTHLGEETQVRHIAVERIGCGLGVGGVSPQGGHQGVHVQAQLTHLGTAAGGQGLQLGQPLCPVGAALVQRGVVVPAVEVVLQLLQGVFALLRHTDSGLELGQGAGAGGFGGPGQGVDRVGRDALGHFLAQDLQQFVQAVP